MIPKKKRLIPEKNHHMPSGKQFILPKNHLILAENEMIPKKKQLISERNHPMPSGNQFIPPKNYLILRGNEMILEKKQLIPEKNHRIPNGNLTHSSKESSDFGREWIDFKKSLRS